MKFYVKVAKSAKTGNNYSCLVADLGYTQKTITFDRAIIQELLDLTPRGLAELPCGEYNLD